MMETVVISGNLYGHYIYIPGRGYLKEDLTCGSQMDYAGKGKGTPYLTLLEAKALLEKYERSLKESTGPTPGARGHVYEAQRKAHVQLLLEGKTSPVVTPVTTRLVTDGRRIVLELLTPGLPPFAIARLEVNKWGKVVMFREKGVKNELVETDSQGRIQN